MSELLVVMAYGKPVVCYEGRGSLKRVPRYVEIHPLALPVEGEVTLGRMRVVMLPTTKQSLPVFKEVITGYDNHPIPTGDVIEVDVPVPITSELVEGVNQAYIDGLIEGAKREISQMPESGGISQFNKTCAGKLTHEKGNAYLLSLGFCILHSYTTGCANTTVIYSLVNPDSDVLKVTVSDKYKGLVIGKGGSNIKKIQNDYNRKIQVS